MASGSTSRQRPDGDGGTHRAGAFDIRALIALLIGVYGAVLVVTGLLATSARDLERAGGTNVNLWAGIGMLVFAAAFVTWARVRPLVVPDDHAEVADRS